MHLIQQNHSYYKSSSFNLSNYVWFSEKCKCPKVIKANWYDIPPYIKDNGHDQEPSGLFPLLLKDIVPVCCGNCSGGDGRSVISYANRRDNLVAIKNIRNFDVNDTITFPISGYKDDRLYQNEYKFMPLVSSPGVAFIVVDEPPGTSANAVFNSVLSGWPVLLLTLLMALLSGIIMWTLVSASYHRLNYCLFDITKNNLCFLGTPALLPFTHQATSRRQPDSPQRQAETDIWSIRHLWLMNHLNHCVVCTKYLF